MSDLKDTLTAQVKASMKSRERDKVKVLRNIQAVIKQIEIDKKIELDDTGVLELLQKQLKQRQESLTIFINNGRDDLAQKEQFEIDIINTFMPQQMTEDELNAMVTDEVSAQGASSMQDMGKLMGALKAKTAGRADPAMISQLVKKALMS